MAFNSAILREGATALIPEEFSLALIKKLVNESITMGTFTRIPVSRAQVRMPVLGALPVAYFTGSDTGLKQTTKLEWKNKYMNIEEIACIVPVPEAVIEDLRDSDGFDLWGEIEPLIATEVARVFDAAVIFGVGAPTVWPTAVVPAAVAAGNWFQRGTAEPSHGALASDVSEVIATVEEDGFSPDYAAAAVSLKGKLRNARNSFGDRFPEISETQIYEAPVKYPARGEWPLGSKKPELITLESNQFVTGIRKDIDVKILDQAVISDGNGVIQFNLAQEDMIALRVRFRAGWQVSNQITYDNPNEETRYAAGVLLTP
ncbi:MAG TPA: phage major capsid protein [Chloroflexota bacterium]|jgi:hypothetical protein|nr:phage major capsid protein [Chloroflexota bacterium]